MSPSRILPLGLIALFVTACGNNDGDPQERESNAPEPLTMRELAPPADAASPTLFARIAPEVSGLQVAALSAEDRKSFEGGVLTIGGLTLGDIDGDGREDLFVVNGPGPNQLFRQTEALTFEDITDSAGVGGGNAWGTGASLADIDNDGDLDLYVCNHDARNQCFLNDGTGVFEDKAEDLGINARAASLMPSLIDYDLDGDLDLYILTHRYFRKEGLPDIPTFTVDGRTEINAEYARWYAVRTVGWEDNKAQHEVYPVGQRDLIYENKGDGTFTRIERAGDLGTKPNNGMSATWLDHNHDGRPDLYVTNDDEDGSHLFLNRGNGQFTQASLKTFPYTLWRARGVALGDLNGDAYLDIFSLASSHQDSESSSLAGFARLTTPPPGTQSALWQHTGQEAVREVASPYGLTLNGLDPWATLLGDYDLDGLTDALIGTTSGLQARRGNPKEATLTEVTEEWGLASSAPIRVLAQADLDADGDVDFLARADDGTVQLYQNTASTGDRLVIDLVATKSPSTPIGTRIEIDTLARTYVRTFSPGSGLQAWHGSRISLALGESPEVESLRVYWPSGIEQQFDDVPSNHHLTITEPDVPPTERASRVQTLYTQIDDPSLPIHGESELVKGRPQSDAMLGPGMACTDVTGDGLDDLYLGGSAGQPGLFLVRKSNSYREPLTEPFIDDAASEDLGSVFADFNTDGHIDLFVVSGGTEAKAGAASYQDRLYLGNGRGAFTKAEGAVPRLYDSGGPVAGADFDHDGDLDLFVGGRCVPGNPGAQATSRLLVNAYEAGQPPRFVPGKLSFPGRVPSALWSDIDDDGWIDLLYVDEHSGVGIYRNHEGQLQKHALGLTLPSGRWSSISAADMDNDGDMDYAVTNLAGESGILVNNATGKFLWKPLPEQAQWAPARSAHWLDADGDFRQDLFLLQNLPGDSWPSNPNAGGVGQAFRGLVRGGFEPWKPQLSGFVVPGVSTALAVTDLNQDDIPDLIIARNNQRMLALTRSPSSHNWLTIRFRGPLRNIMGSGARVSVEWNGRRRILTELQTGSSHLTQSPNRIFFPRPQGDGQGLIKVNWPDGGFSQLGFTHRDLSTMIRYNSKN